MQIVTYRGPSQPGGVATLIQRADCSQSTWWHVKDTAIHSVSASGTRRVAQIPHAIIEGHYNYSNEFLWPLMHGREDLAVYNERDRNCYRSMNLALASHLNWHQNEQFPFLHDYQLALVPHYLSPERADKSLHFWHIPWPERFAKEFVDQIAEIVRSLLCCNSLGFHTAEYVNNFCEFVRRHIPEVEVSSENEMIVHPGGRTTKLVVSPGGINYSFWHQAAQAPSAAPASKMPYILSVDRADYTKGIAQRIDAVHRLFTAHPELQGKFQFVFACQRTRQGVKAFDEYWMHCRTRYERVMADLTTADWSPILWLSEPVTPQVLAGWYANASAMLVNPSRDGLNLTAKEFVASARNQGSTLILSRGAGVWHELKDYVVTIDQCDPQAIANAIVSALLEPAPRRRSNLQALKRIVRTNSWDRWWQHLTGSVQPNRSLRLVPLTPGAA